MKSENIVIQVAHGRLIPSYSSAYSKRCVRYLSNLENRMIFTTGGLIFHDEESDGIKQYRSILMTGLALLKGGRSLEILLSKGKWLRKRYLKDLRSAVEKSHVIVFEGPWQFYLLKDLLAGKIVVYDAHNVEYLLRKNSPWENYTRKLESELVRRADHIVTLSDDDVNSFIELYGKENYMVTGLAEGYERPICTWNGVISRELIFIGSAYVPNLEAANNIVSIAHILPEYTFKIVGSVCNSLRKWNLPENVKLLGVLDDIAKEKEICKSFLALNPVLTGSGRNTKMIDYISHGIPIITTETGARGFSPEIRRFFDIGEPNEFPALIRKAETNGNLLLEKSSGMIDYAQKNDYEKTMQKSVKLFQSLFEKLQETGK